MSTVTVDQCTVYRWKIHQDATLSPTAAALSSFLVGQGDGVMKSMNGRRPRLTFALEGWLEWGGYFSSEEAFRRCGASGVFPEEMPWLQELAVDHQGLYFTYYFFVM
jgi:hypothetical protein